MKADDCSALIEVTRGNVVESIHYGAFVVMDSKGRVLAGEGSPQLQSYPRSSMKPFQALPFIERGGEQVFNFTDQEVALMCASHSGTEMHTAVLSSMHRKIGTSEADLACGIHWPSSQPAREALKLAGKTPNQFHHNCAGKHTGMLAHALLRGLAIENYLDPQHPVQISIRETVAQMVGLDPEQMPMGIDGCSAPVYSIPLENMAQGVAFLADPVNLTDARAAACRKITHAMMTNPIMVAGPGEFDTELMSAAGERLFSKMGAEGYLIIGVMPGVLRPHSPGLGIAIKISDGDRSGRARSAVAMTILSGLGLLDNLDLTMMAKFGNIPVKNWRKLNVGDIRPAFSIRNINS